MEDFILIPGMIIKADYSHRQHRIVKITRGCYCAKLSDELGYTCTGMQYESPEHIHIHAKDLEDNMSSYFNGYVEKQGKIKSIWDSSEIIITEIPKTYQLEFF